MARRRFLSQSQFNGGYTDSLSPVAAPPNTMAAGSFGQFLLGENVTRPFAGFVSKGAGSGMRYACQFGSTWGGLQSFGSAAGQGSQMLSMNNSLFVIGAGKASREGAKLQVQVGSYTIASGDVNTGTGVITRASHGLSTGDPVYWTTTGTVPLGLAANTAYFVINVTANTFQLATSYLNAQAGTAVTGGTTGTGTNNLYYGDDIVATPTLQKGSILHADYLYEYVDQAGLGQADVPTVVVPTSPSAGYTGFINGAISIKIARIRDRQLQGVDIDSPNAPVRGRASGASAVVIPNNKTIQITFPSASAQQTHWAVFSTQPGFADIGAFYRLGWRSSSSSSATWYFGISETTVAAATNRTLEFDFTNGDLLPESAWIEDYAPEAGSHAVQLENLMIVFGTYDGTVAQVSLPGFFESYNPFHTLYFPEPVTAVLHRVVDDYALVACRNSIHAVQYVGYRGSDLPSATITTLIPDAGIAYQNNWAAGGGMVIAFIEGVGLAAIGTGGTIDYEFGRQVNVLTRDWDAVDVVIGFNPNTRTFVCGNGNVSVSFCLETGVWSAPVYNTDAGLDRTWVSAINSRGKMIATLYDSGTSDSTAYEYDYSTAPARMPLCTISQWQTPQVGRSVNIYEGDIAFEIGQILSTGGAAFVGFHTNFFPTHIRGISSTSGSANITCADNPFTSAYTGKRAILFGDAINTGGDDYLLVKLNYVSASTVQMLNITTGSPETADVTLDNLFMLVGEDFFVPTATENRQQFALNVRPAIQNVRAWAVSTFLYTDGITGNVYSQSVFGTGSESSDVNV